MKKWLRIAGYALLAFLLAAGAGYWWVFVETHKADVASYPIDIAEIRRLADAQPGEKPQRIRVETVAHLAAPQTIVMAGNGWETVDLPVSSYELQYSDRSIVVDTALTPAIAKSMSARTFDAASYARMSNALAHAAQIVLTHEHPDHAGGLFAQPNLKQLFSVTRLTPEQVAELKVELKSDPFTTLHVPANVFAGYRPMAYPRYRAIAPGVVLIKAPGHTPGSQMVYVRRADGVELLLLGDVAWQMRGVETGREKARIVSLMTGENRAQVRDELAALGAVHTAHPELHMMPGHDAAAIDSFVASGLLVKGF